MADEFLKEFLTSSAWQQMQELLNEIIDEPILWVVGNSGETLLNLDQHYPEFCRIVRSNAKGLQACDESRQARIKEAKKNHCAIISNCPCGLVGYALPLVLDTETIGFSCGYHQMFGSPPTPKKMDEISSLSGIGVNELKKYIKRIKVMSPTERKRLTNILTMFVGTSSLLMKMFGEDGLHQSVLGYMRDHAGDINAQSLLDNIYNDLRILKQQININIISL